MVTFKSYEKYKYSGVEWIGEIPENWTLKKVKYLADPNQYYPIGDGDHGSIKPEMYQEEGIPYIRVQNLTWGNELDFNGMVYISEEVNEANKKSILRPKDILIAKTGATVGKTAILPEEIKVANTTSSVGKVSVDHKKYYYKYVAYFFQSYLFKQQINLTAYQKSAQPGFNIDDLIEYQVVLPLNLKEQQQIADFLDKKTSEIADLIADKEKLIELLEEKRQAIITEAVTKGLNSNVKMKDSGVEWIGEIPEGWDVSKIKYQADINKYTLSENTDEDLEIKYIDISSVNSRGEVVNIEKYYFKDAPSRARRILRKGDTIISTVRTYLKAITWFEEVEENLICSTGFAVLSPKETIYPKYLSYLMRSTKYIDEIVKRSIGVSYPAITSTEIGMMECLLPNINEQKMIVEYIDNELKKIDGLVDEIKFQIQKLKEYRQSLIYEAVTGKIDVRDYVKA